MNFLALGGSGAVERYVIHRYQWAHDGLWDKVSGPPTSKERTLAPEAPAPPRMRQFRCCHRCLYAAFAMRNQFQHRVNPNASRLNILYCPYK